MDAAHEKKYAIPAEDSAVKRTEMLEMGKLSQEGSFARQEDYQKMARESTVNYLAGKPENESPVFGGHAEDRAFSVFSFSLILFGSAYIIIACDFPTIQKKRGPYYMEYMSVSKTAQKWGISQRRIQLLCGEGRIKGVFRLGRAWAIPANAEKPDDARVKSGKYIKQVKDIKEAGGEAV